MNYAQQLFRLALLGAINHQITHIVVAGSIFAEAREFCKRCHPKLGELVTCNLCFGTWVGFLLAFVFRPRFVQSDQGGGLFKRPSVQRQVVGFLADSFAIALAGRFYTEILAILRNQAAFKEEQKRLVEEQVEQLDQQPAEQGGEPIAQPS